MYSSAMASSCTPRAFAVGSTLSLLLAVACPYTVFLHHTAGMAADFITAGAIFLFFVFTAFINTALHRLRASLALRAGELVVVYTMMAVASAIPTWGLVANLLPVLPGAFYYATPENDWEGLIQPHIPEWLAPRDPLAIKYFYEGLPADHHIPWDAWLLPLASWAVLVLAVYAVMAATVLLLRRQWIEHERLVFPLTELPLEMLRGDTGRLPPILRSPLLWVGFLLPFVIFSTRGLNHYFNFIPALQTDTMLTLGHRSMMLRLFLGFPVIGLTYFLNLNVAFSLWFFHLAARAESALFHLIGYEVPGHGETFTGSALGTSPGASHQAMGAMIVLAAVTLWMARGHLRRMLWAPDEYGESGRGAAAVLVVGLTIIITWLWASGMPLWLAPVFTMCAFAVFLGLARIVAEGGVGFCRPQMIAPVFGVYGFGTEAFGHPGLVAAGFTYTWTADIRTSVMSSAFHGLKLADEIGVRERAGLMGAVLLAVVLTLVGAVVTTLWLAYTYGGINLQSWFFGGMPRTVFGFVADKMNNPLTPAIIATRWGFTIGGAGVMGLLVWMRHRFLWWPLHYLGLPIADTWVMSWVWFGIAVGWLLKLLLLKYGGVPAYRAGRPFFLGLILGQISCVALWMIIDIATGTLGNYIHIGSP
jgi:hypothetical protein